MATAWGWPLGPLVTMVAVRLRSRYWTISSWLISIWLRWLVPMRRDPIPVTGRPDRDENPEESARTVSIGGTVVRWSGEGRATGPPRSKGCTHDPVPPLRPLRRGPGR